MKEMINNTTNQGASMKKIVLIVALATVLVFAFASTAMAKNAVQQRVGDPTVAEPQGTYNNWSGYLENVTQNAPATSPHGNYATTTVKCAVCHSVHAAAPSGDTLLRVTAAEACAYCHVETALTGKVIYGGDIAIATGSGQDHHTIGSNCDECHTGVHGVGSISNVDAFVGLLLKEFDSTNAYGTRTLNPATNVAALPATVSAGWTVAQLTDSVVAAGERQGAIGMFCVGCHSGSYQNVTPSGAGNFYYGNYAGDGFMAATWQPGKTGHRVMATANANWNVGNSVSTSTKVTGQVAFANADVCIDCHDADNGFGAYGFPHFTPGAARFLNTASYAGSLDETRAGVSVSADPATVLEPNWAGGTTGDAAVAKFSLRDGVCLKCHRGAVNTGVGFDY